MENQSLTPTEHTIAKLWEELIGHTDPITSDTDFFEIGGNSLIAIQLLSRIDDLFGQDVLPPDILFSMSRLNQIASVIDQAVKERTVN